MSEDFPVVHLYGQEMWHCEAFILGNAEGLRALRDAIDRALAAPGQPQAFEPFVRDGEGYALAIACLDDETMGRAALPYHDEMFASMETGTPLEQVPGLYDAIRALRPKAGGR